MKTQVVAGLIGMTLAGSTVSAQAPALTPAFEVASIRAASLPTPETMRSGQFRVGTRINGRRVDIGFVSLADLLPYAYRVKSFQIAGPAWMRESRWNILANLPEGVSEGQAPEMMQGLLADRFKLEIHREKREQPVYELVVVKGGPKMEASAAGDDEAGTSAAGNAGPFGFPLGGLRGGPGNISVDGRGGRGAVIAGGPTGTTRISPGDNCGMRMEFSKLTMQTLADTLTPFLDRPVVDETGLVGAFKVTLNLPMEAMFGMVQNMARTAGLPSPGLGGGPGGGLGGRGLGDGPPGRGGPAGCPGGPDALAAGADASNVAIFQAVQQLGLKLQPRKAPFETIVVDRLEKMPTEN